MGDYYNPGGYRQYDANGDQLLFETMSRLDMTDKASLVTQTLYLSYMTAGPIASTLTTTYTNVSTPAASATPTVCRIGLYTIDSAGAGALVASTTNDTALWNATFTLFTKVLTTSYTLIPGQRYAAGLLCVTAGTAPDIVSNTNFPAAALMNTIAPRLCGTLAGQADLPASFTNASLGTAANRKMWVGFA